MDSFFLLPSSRMGNILAYVVRIGLIGKGKMGSLIQQEASHFPVTIAHTFDSKTPLCKEVDMFIDFSTGSSVLPHVSYAATYHKNIIIGTTGWYQDLPKIHDIVLQSNIGLLYSPNFSISIFQFLELLKKAVVLFHDYDIHFTEKHHIHKKDKPSGTALLLHKELNLDIPILSEREGEDMGTHTLTFSNNYDTITLSHHITDRRVFAQGALHAALWLFGKQGFFTLKDML